MRNCCARPKVNLERVRVCACKRQKNGKISRFFLLLHTHGARNRTNRIDSSSVIRIDQNQCPSSHIVVPIPYFCLFPHPPFSFPSFEFEIDFIQIFFHEFRVAIFIFINVRRLIPQIIRPLFDITVPNRTNCSPLRTCIWRHDETSETFDVFPSTDRTTRCNKKKRATLSRIRIHSRLSNRSDKFVLCWCHKLHE